MSKTKTPPEPSRPPPERIFRGDGKRQYEPLPGAFDRPEPYVAAPELREAINVALFLRRPLLLEGEPGTGKTRLAHAVAYELGLPLFEVHVRSTSRAQDLLWTYDAVRRLYHIQRQTWKTLAGGPSPPRAPRSQDSPRRPGDSQPRSQHRFVSIGQLGQAIKLAEQQVPSVVLIDEIDKADLDFPNDLLHVIEELRFTIAEVPDLSFDALRGRTREECREWLPLFIITSNREKELPAPFLRRCLFYFIEFPNPKELEDIVRKHFGKDPSPLLQAAILKFRELRATTGLKWRKVPGTSELIDWARVLEQDERERKVTANGLARTSLDQLPHREVLIKTQADHQGLLSTGGALGRGTRSPDPGAEPGP